MVLPLVSRFVDAVLGRGEGLDASGDPFGPPLDAARTRHALDAVRDAHFAEATPPFATPAPVPDTVDTVHVTLRPPREGSAWALIAPPYGAGSPRGTWGLYELHARLLARAGFGVALVEAPFHARRASRGKPSGYGFVRADLGHTMRAACAYAADVAATARHVRDAQGATRVVGLGISLGGEALGLAAALEAPVDAVAFLAAVDNPASFYGTGRNRAARRRTLADAGYDLARVEQAFAPVAPSTYAAPPVPRLFVVPEHDLVVPAATQHAWARAWAGEVDALPTAGHGTGIASPRVAARVAAWLRERAPQAKT